VTDRFTLAIDAMGGDAAPAAIVAGLDIAAERHPTARLLLVGDEAALTPLLARYKRAAAISTVRHTAEVIGSDMKPTAALRMRNASMRLAIDAVANGEAAGVVSAGNTGALLALAAAGKWAQDAVARAGGPLAVKEAMRSHPAISFRGEFDQLREWLRASTSGK